MAHHGELEGDGGGAVSIVLQSQAETEVLAIFRAGSSSLLAPAAASFSTPLLLLLSLGLVCWCEPHGGGEVW